MKSTNTISIVTDQGRWELNLDTLPNDVSSLLTELEANKVPLKYWFQIASFYYKHGSVENFKRIAERSMTPECVELYWSQKGDRVRLINALTFHYMMLKDTEHKKENESTVKRLMKQANDIESDCISNFLLKGMFHLMNRDYQNAERMFSNAEGVVAKECENAQDAENSSEHHFVAGKIGRACVQLCRGKYREALQLYHEALKTNAAACGVGVRLGIARCNAAEEHTDLADLAVERAAACAPDCAEVKAALATILRRQAFDTDDDADAKQTIKESVTLAADAYRTNKDDKLIKSILAEHFFYHQEDEKALSLAKQVVDTSTSSKNRSEGYYQLGRIYHRQRRFDDALNAYNMAIDADKDNVLPRLGAAQLTLRTAMLDEDADTATAAAGKCVAHLDAVLSSGGDRGCGSTLVRLLSAVANARLGDCTAACELLRDKEALQRIEDESLPRTVSLRVLGDSVRAESPELALRAYTECRDAHKARGERPPPALLADLAAECLTTATGDGAVLPDPNDARLLDALMACRAVLLGEEQGDAPAADSHGAAPRLLDFGDVAQMIRGADEFRISVWYNLGLLFRALGREDLAYAVFSELVVARPAFADAYLCLYEIYTARGEYSRAERLLFGALQAVLHDERVWVALGNHCLAHNAPSSAQKVYERVLASQPQNAGALLGMGMLFRKSLGDLPLPKNLERERKFCQRALRSSPADMGAAMGAALALADHGRFETGSVEGAEQLLRTCLVDDPGSVEAFANLGYVLLLGGKNNKAADAFEDCIAAARKKRRAAPAHVYNALARAYFETDRFADAKRVLQEAVLLAPTDPTLLFNLSSVVEKMAYAAQSSQTATVADIDAAAAGVDRFAAPTLRWLSTQRNFGETTKRHLDGYDVLTRELASKRAEAEQREHARAEEARLREEHARAEQERRAQEARERKAREEAERKAREEQERKAEELTHKHVRILVEAHKEATKNVKERAASSDRAALDIVDDEDALDLSDDSRRKHRHHKHHHKHHHRRDADSVPDERDDEELFSENQLPEDVKRKREEELRQEHEAAERERELLRERDQKIQGVAERKRAAAEAERQQQRERNKVSREELATFDIETGRRKAHDGDEDERQEEQHRDGTGAHPPAKRLHREDDTD